MVKCPKCDFKVAKRGLSSHKDSKRCIARRKRQKLEGKGYKIIPSKKLKNYLEEHDYETKRGPISYDSGSYWYSRNSRIVYGYWAKEEVVNEKKKEVLSGSYHSSWDKVKETREYIAIKKRSSSLKLDVFKKDKSESTRRRVFHKGNGYVYNTDNEKFGEIVDWDESDINFKVLGVKLRLKNS